MRYYNSKTDWLYIFRKSDRLTSRLINQLQMYREMNVNWTGLSPIRAWNLITNTKWSLSKIPNPNYRTPIKNNFDQEENLCCSKFIRRWKEELQNSPHGINFNKDFGAKHKCAIFLIKSAAQKAILKNLKEYY